VRAAIARGFGGHRRRARAGKRRVAADAMWRAVAQSWRVEAIMIGANSTM